MHIFWHAVFWCKLIILAFNPEGAPNGFDSFRSCRLIERNTDTAFAHSTQIDTLIKRRFHHRRLKRPDIHSDRIKKALRIDFKARSLKPLGQTHGLAVNTLRNRLKTFGAMKDRIHRRHHSQQSLSCTDVARGFLAADMLLAGLQAEPISAVAVTVH